MTPQQHEKEVKMRFEIWLYERRLTDIQFQLSTEAFFSRHLRLYSNCYLRKWTVNYVEKGSK